MRLLVQSVSTGRFLAAAPDGGSPEWVRSLKEAGGGVVGDWETAMQLLEDNADLDHDPVIIDLDRLGTAQDYKRKSI